MTSPDGRLSAPVEALYGYLAEKANERRPRYQRQTPAFDLCLAGHGSKTSTLVGLAGIEPATSALSVLRSNRLSYSPQKAGWPRYTTPSDHRAA